jgi:hypothetical protein
LAKNNETYYLFWDSVFYSPDLGQSWNNIPLDEPGLGIRCVDVKGDTMLFGGDNNFNPRIKMTWNQGESWTDLLDNLPVLPYWNYTRINQIKIADGRIMVGNPQFGLWYRDDILTSTNEKIHTQSPDILHLLTYPNPATTSTTIEYTLPHDDFVLIKIFNSQGSQIAQIDGFRSKGMHHEVWPTGGLASGYYTFSLQTNDHTVSGKIIRK